MFGNLPTNVKLTSYHGHLVTYQRTLPFVEWPEILFWGSRAFIDARYFDKDSGHRVYREAVGTATCLDYECLGEAVVVKRPAGPSLVLPSEPSPTQEAKEPELQPAVQEPEPEENAPHDSKKEKRRRRYNGFGGFGDDSKI